MKVLNKLFAYTSLFFWIAIFINILRLSYLGQESVYGIGLLLLIGFLISTPLFILTSLLLKGGNDSDKKLIKVYVILVLTTPVATFLLEKALK